MTPVEEGYSGSDPFPIICIGQMKAATTWLFELLSYAEDVWVGPHKEIHFLDVYEQVGATTIGQRLNYYDPNSQNQQFEQARSAYWRPELDSFIRQFGATIGSPLTATGVQHLKWWEFFLFAERNWEWYRCFFLWAFPKKCVDVTPRYDTCSDETIAAVARELSNARIIFLIRNPLAQVVSHFAWGVKHDSPVGNLVTDWEQFRALAEGSGEGQTMHALRDHLNEMLSITRASYNLNRWLAFIPEDRVFVGFMDDIVNHQARFISSLEQFLNTRFHLPNGGLAPVNKGVQIRVDGRVGAWLSVWCEREAKELVPRFGELPNWWAGDIARFRKTLSYGLEPWRYRGLATPEVSFSSGVLSRYNPNWQSKEKSLASH